MINVNIEAKSINKSLSALGDVINALTTNLESTYWINIKVFEKLYIILDKDKFIPYRNNKLTMLMKDSIGGSVNF